MYDLEHVRVADSERIRIIQAYFVDLLEFNLFNLWKLK